MAEKHLLLAEQRRPAGHPDARIERFLATLRRWFEKRPGGIRFKLAMVTLALIALITTGFSLVAIHTLDRALRDSLVQRGRTLAVAAATPAAYSILSGDRLALDNLAAQIGASQQDVAFLAILDHRGTVLAHTRLEETGESFQDLPGEAVSAGSDFALREVVRGGQPVFECRVPVSFAEKQVGEVVVGIEAAPYRAARLTARYKMVGVSLLALAVGLGGTLVLARRFTLPIERLSAGVARVRQGEEEVQVASVSRDELGELTRSFNAMTRTIQAQKKGLKESARDLEQSYVSTVRILAAALDARDNYTLNHSARVASLSLRVGRRLGLAQDALRELEIACFLHDIGKIRVPDRVLNKPGPLDAEEGRLIRRHPEEGAQILDLAHSLHKYVPVVRHHHEWYDGSGYPDGLKGEEIPLFAQIVAIADAYDAMTSSRPYRPGRSLEEAVEEIRAFRGRQFAPRIADLFIEALQEESAEQCSFIAAAL